MSWDSRWRMITCIQSARQNWLCNQITHWSRAMLWAMELAICLLDPSHGTVGSTGIRQYMCWPANGLSLYDGIYEQLLPLLMLQLHPGGKIIRFLEWCNIQRVIRSLVQRYSSSRSNMPSRSSGHYVAVGRSLKGAKPHPNGYYGNSMDGMIPHL